MSTKKIREALDLLGRTRTYDLAMVAELLPAARAEVEAIEKAARQFKLDGEEAKMSTKKDHRMSLADSDGVRLCMEPGCTMRTAQSDQFWQRKKGAHWRSIKNEPIPTCIAKESK